MSALEIRVVRKGSWKEREVGKFKVGKSEIKLERFKLVGSGRKWKVRAEVRRFELKLESSG